MNMPIRHITFDPVPHTYVDEHGNDYISMTTLCGSYEKEVDWDYWAAKKARERGITKKEMLAEWNRLKDEGNEKGSKKHNELEEAINNVYQEKTVQVTPDTGENKTPTAKTTGLSFKYKIVNITALDASPLRQQHPNIYKYLAGLIEQGYTLYTEKRLYTSIHYIAGTADVMAVKGKNFVIVDWKTNKDPIMFTSGYFKKEWKSIGGEWRKVKTDIWVPKNDRMKPPLQNMPECTGSVYTLQTGGYALIAEYWGMKCDGIVLWHLHDGSPSPIKYDIPYVKDTLIKMFNDRLKKMKEPTKGEDKQISFGVY